MNYVGLVVGNYPFFGMLEILYFRFVGEFRPNKHAILNQFGVVKLLCNTDQFTITNTKFHAI
jgi:hypothetical protein